MVYGFNVYTNKLSYSVSMCLNEYVIVCCFSKGLLSDLRPAVVSRSMNFVFGSTM